MTLIPILRRGGEAAKGPFWFLQQSSAQCLLKDWVYIFKRERLALLHLCIFLLFFFFRDFLNFAEFYAFLCNFMPAVTRFARNQIEKTEKFPQKKKYRAEKFSKKTPRFLFFFYFFFWFFDFFFRRYLKPNFFNFYRYSPGNCPGEAAPPAHYVA